MRLKIFIFILITAVLVAAVFLYLRYLNPVFVYHQAPKAAFVISFDDQYIEDWYRQRNLFKKYRIQATFFITNPDSLTPEDVSMLKALASDGHEIASHGAHHINSLQYIKEYGMAKYIEYEVIPSIRVMHEKGFVPVTFAYPYGANSKYTDHELSKYFYLLRGDSWKVKGKPVDELDKVFYTYDGRRVINGLGIDHGSGITLEDIGLLFTRAANRKEAVVLYAHAINNSDQKYTISPAMLESIFKAAQKQELASVTFKSLLF